MSVEDPVLGSASIARILQVSPRTVAKLVDSGKLRGHCIPCSNTRRVLRSDLVAFCREADLPPAMIVAAESAQRETHGRRRKPGKEGPCPDSGI
jgi:hypothetical protein